jgi:molybdate transport system substrate-binding protein
MTARRWIASVLSLAVALLLLAGGQTAVSADDIVVSAAASLTDVLQEIGKSYQSQSKHKILLTLGPSSFLARQIDEGAPADIFFSADLAQMDMLDRNGRLEPGTRRNLLSNQLVLIAPANSKIAVGTPKDLLRDELRRIALADPAAVPVGVYTSKYLADEGLWDKIRVKIVPVLDVRATLASVEAGNVDVGFVYKTDAAISRKVKIIYEVPIDKGPKIVYPAALVKDSKKKPAARDFMSFVLSSAGKRAFKKYGFVVVE